ncbi:hypothetical protein M2282_006232 [Variovorax boronicumulans]|uniref:hypothetical protein n=1 Tax=Variovorax boronicumulans TaxID=436515 RepID=UPI002476A7BE|nr:hypothetical protein [Variovorax boronicumulans]MDH6171046.1 hypothetical protein [Variovorax boronicumulans]
MLTLLKSSARRAAHQRLSQVGWQALLPTEWRVPALPPIRLDAVGFSVAKEVGVGDEA